MWETITLPISCGADRVVAEQILLTAAREHAVVDEQHARDALAFMRSREAMAGADPEPAVHWRLTDNWLELSLRFQVRPGGVPEGKDRMSRQVLTGLDAAGTGLVPAGPARATAAAARGISGRCAQRGPCLPRPGPSGWAPTST